MAYASTGDVARYIGRGDKLFSSNSPVSVADIEGLIDDVAYEIDGLLTHLEVTLPLTLADNPEAWKFLKRLNSLGAAAFLELRLFGEASPGTLRGTTRHEILLKEYHDLFGKIEKGILILSDVEGGTVDDMDLASSGSIHDEDGNDVDPFFKRADEY